MLQTVIDALRQGGTEWILWLLIGLSTVSLTIILERALFHWKRRIDIDHVAPRVDALLARGDANEAIRVLRQYPSMEAEVSVQVLMHASWPSSALEDLYRSVLESERLRYEARIGFLATIGSNSPFIGLFGTVLGIVAAFSDLSGANSGANRSQVIMQSISEALVCTAVGIVVAIPAVMAYNAFQRRSDRSVGAAESMVRGIMARLKAPSA